MNTLFVWDPIRVELDANRSGDGVDLRNRFADANGYNALDIWNLYGSCRVLEMMVALALRCEETIMMDPDYEDRTSKWFWEMIDNMGLGHITDGVFDENEGYVEDRISIMLNRKYNYDGSGGAMFVVRNPREDLRKTDIWYQMMWWLSENYGGDDWCR